MQKIFIEIPTWLGDTVMTTPAIENICAKYPKAHLTIFGSKIATQIFTYHPQVKKIIIDKSRISKNRFFYLYKITKKLHKFDIAISFRRRIFAKILIFFITAKVKYVYKRSKIKNKHLVIRYNNFINYAFKINTIAAKLKIHLLPQTKNISNKSLGINPGATYGSAKCWYANKFATVANNFTDKKIIIFGSDKETNIANKITTQLITNNYLNLSGKLSIIELCKYIKNLDIFITADSGPMHIAAAFNIKTVALFGPTKDYETSPWKNPYAVILKKYFSCQPCMQKICHLTGNKYHQCMQTITANEVIKTIKSF